MLWCQIGARPSGPHCVDSHVTWIHGFLSPIRSQVTTPPLYHVNVVKWYWVEHMFYISSENTVTLRARNIKQHSKILCTFYGLILYDFDDSLVVRAYNVSAEVVYHGCTISKWFISLYDYVMTLKRSPCVCYCPFVWFTGSFPSLRNFVAHVVVSLNPPQSVFTYVQYYP